MKKTLILYILNIFYFLNLFSQSTTSAVALETIYAQNGLFYLHTIPYDNQEPSLRGKTCVYRINDPVPLYEFDRGFDNAAEHNLLTISNDGETIFYIAQGVDDKTEGQKPISIYQKGKLVQTYTVLDITGCDQRKERCNLVYNNYQQVVDKEKSHFGTKNYKKVFKDNVPEKDRFLSDYAVFSNNDTVYLTDPKRIVHIFDLKQAKHVLSLPLDSIYERLYARKRTNQTHVKTFDAPYLPIEAGFLRLKGGEQTPKVLGRYIGMKPTSSNDKKYNKYKNYSVHIEATVSREGKMAIEKLEIQEGLPKQKIIKFFEANHFDISFVPQVFDQWYFSSLYLKFRKKSRKKAKFEKLEEIAQRQKEQVKKMMLDSINGIYIPRDLQDSFKQLDLLLDDLTKKEMQALPNNGGMGQYHHGLGTWMRNNWGLWGGSRLQKYFIDKNVNHPDDMSWVILEHYHDWLNGKKDTWRDWEQNH